MLMVVLKNGGTWEFLDHIFKISTPTFIKTMTSYLRVVAPKLTDDWVDDKAEEEKMRMLVTLSHAVGHYPCALYRTAMNFRQAPQPSVCPVIALSTNCMDLRSKSLSVLEALQSIVLSTSVATLPTSSCSITARTSTSLLGS